MVYRAKLLMQIYDIANRASTEAGGMMLTKRFINLNRGEFFHVALRS